ncbi:hypothetical protein [Phosphitispora fastidiosa]|uniref:hypothetical protein n=1 Tax=Phosphitispora fastidiosa TaxID=2837202 RepID=UPI001E3A79BF|nr:hypothetical protein [Phosphitispora fastidiosa]MBU7005206.1 hypothetical protein [Phosphitispora fastidiosa]
MKLNIFYSWESDLPNNKNRGLIGDCIDKAMLNIYSRYKTISEYIIETDSRNELGTPDLAQTIFSKIDICDIFIADISIINARGDSRLTPNPNVLLELGFASKSIGWSNIVCIYNLEYAEVEKLPFDIRYRKPICYNTAADIASAKKLLIKLLESYIAEIIEKRVIDKKEYLETKRQVDLGIQAILIDLCTILFKKSDRNIDRYNYSRMLNSSEEDIANLIADENYLGFELYKNVTLNITEFVDFFKDEIETYFLPEKEKRLIAKMVYALRQYKRVLDNDKTLEFIEKDTVHKIISGNDINQNNPKNLLILVEPIDDQKAIVISEGNFERQDIGILLYRYSICRDSQPFFARSIYSIIQIANDWIRETGNYFILNPRHFERDNQG